MFSLVLQVARVGLAGSKEMTTGEVETEVMGSPG